MIFAVFDLSPLTVYINCRFIHLYFLFYYQFCVDIFCRSLRDYSDFWPTVLSVEPLVQCLVCLSVCNVLYCGKTVRPSEKVSEGVNRKPGSKCSFFGSPPYFYFRFRRYGHRDGRFCLIFARTAQRSILDGTNWLFSSKPCAYCRIVWLELKPDSVLFVFITVRSLRPRNLVKYLTTVKGEEQANWLRMATFILCRSKEYAHASNKLDVVTVTLQFRIVAKNVFLVSVSPLEFS